MRGPFDRLLSAGTEGEVQAVLDAEGLATDNSKWTPYGNNEHSTASSRTRRLSRPATPSDVGIWNSDIPTPRKR